jgi:hypothetical protein
MHCRVFLALDSIHCVCLPSSSYVEGIRISMCHVDRSIVSAGVMAPVEVTYTDRMWSQSRP